MLSHIQAKTMVDSLPSMTPELSLLTRAIAWLETNYGAGWKGNGVGSHNMGAITGKYKGKSFGYGDSRYDEKQGVVKYTTDFRLYPDDRTGFEDLAYLLRRSYSKAINEVPDWPAVSAALYGYYLGTQPKEQAISTHAKRLESVVNTIVAKTGERTPGTMLGGSEATGAAVLGVGALLVLLAVSRRRKRKAKQ